MLHQFSIYFSCRCQTHIIIFTLVYRILPSYGIRYTADRHLEWAVTDSEWSPWHAAPSRGNSLFAVSKLRNCTVLYCTVLYFTVLYCTVLYCTVLYCTVLYCTVLYCAVLYSSLIISPHSFFYACMLHAPSQFCHSSSNPSFFSLSHSFIGMPPAITLPYVCPFLTNSIFCFWPDWRHRWIKRSPERGSGGSYSQNAG